jgi:TRAP-type C4-dicarboxylate transport system permease small subunit
VKRLCDLVHDALGRALVVLVGVIFIQPSRWTEELAGFQLSWVALLGAAWVLREGAHPGLDLVYRQLGPRLRRGADVLGAALIALFAMVVFVYGGVRLVQMTQELDQRTAALGWPMAVVYSVVPIAGALLTLFALEALLDALRAPAEERP